MTSGLPASAPRLQDGYVVLREWSERDVALLEEVAREPEVTGITAVPEQVDRTSALLFIAARRQSLAAGRALSLVVRPAASAGGVGAVNLNSFGGRPAGARLGYWLARSARGRGYARHAVDLLAGWAFERLSLEQIELRIEPANDPSQRVARACGFAQTGTVEAVPYGADGARPLQRWLRARPR